ncbi:unnamed protein product [Plutella xylostella]|uniref:(diamondback moth) hypothetical protein n=1 Tax=Plutella xylostella TaxID=51655 RepID=A0A8S4GAC1_PLUXY|nr:unnamed protein product [Plutella xylostella]
MCLSLSVAGVSFCGSDVGGFFQNPGDELMTRTWGFLAVSTPMCLSLSVAGVSFCGSDVSGFFQNPGDELMTRWYQVSEKIVCKVKESCVGMKESCEKVD